jgi:hypothetical protein
MGLIATFFKQMYGYQFDLQKGINITNRVTTDIIYVLLSSARQNKESEKGLFNTNKQKTNTRTYNVCKSEMIC